MKLFWVAHTRGPNFHRLREKGFLTFFPDVDDYVFLEATPANEHLLRRQTELGIAFLKGKRGYTKVDEQELASMTKRTITDKIAAGTQILVVEGYGSNLEGTVTEIDATGQKVRCSLTGYNRNYDCWLDRMEIVEHPTRTAQRRAEFHQSI